MIVDGTRDLQPLGSFMDLANRWALTTKEDLVDLTDKAEPVLFEKAGWADPVRRSR